MIHISQISGASALQASVENLETKSLTINIDSFTTEATDDEFLLTETPADEVDVEVFINGIKYKENVDFTVDRNTRILTWTSSDVELEDNWEFSARYYYHNVSSGTILAGDPADNAELERRIQNIETRLENLKILIAEPSDSGTSSDTQSGTDTGTDTGTEP